MNYCTLPLFVFYQAERDASKAKAEELEQDLAASKGREGVLSAELEETQGRLEVWELSTVV